MATTATTISSWSQTQTQIASAYDNLTLHIVPGPRSLSYFIPLLIVPLSLCLPPDRLSHRQLRYLVLPVLYAVQIYVWMKHQSFDVISTNHALVAFMLLGWYDVRRNFRYVRRKGEGEAAAAAAAARQGVDGDGGSAKQQRLAMSEGHHKTSLKRTTGHSLEPYPDSTIGRMSWVGLLTTSLRLTDWHIGLVSHDIRQPSSLHPFKSFYLNILAQAILSYVLLDLSSTSNISSFCNTSPTRTESISIVYIVQPLMLLAKLYAALSLLTSFLPNLLVLTTFIFIPRPRHNQLVSPLTWPSHFGRFDSLFHLPRTTSETTGLRAFWGTFWHQNMRHMTSTPGIALSSVLGLESGSLSRYMIIVTSSFFFSGVVHMGVVPPQPVGTDWTTWQLRTRLASFFWLQVLGMGAEVVVQRSYIHSSASSDPGTDFVRHNGGKGKMTEVMDRHAGTRRESRGFRVSSLRMLGRLAIFVWTVSFLATTAWFTIHPVGCELHWWYLPLVPVSIVNMVQHL